MLRSVTIAAALAASIVVVPSVRGDSIYLIGNSLTYDLSVWHLGSPVGYHIDCNKNLQYIHDNPGDPCVPSHWPTGLAAHTYDWLSVQPFFGTTLAQDAAVISEWMDMQPSATVVIHTGWTHAATFEETYHGGWPGGDSLMNHSPEYFEALRAELLTLHPGRSIIINDAIGVLDQIYHDIEAGIAPYSDLSDLYRDPIHMSYADGYYLARDTMRHTLGLPFGNPPLEPVPPDRLVYLRAVIANCPADINRDQVADVMDLLAYLDQWFSASARAERDGAEGVDVFDLLVFLDAWFAGC